MRRCCRYLTDTSYFCTHPSPSFSNTSNTSSGCLVKLSSLSFFSLLIKCKKKRKERKYFPQKLLQKKVISNIIKCSKSNNIKAKKQTVSIQVVFLMSLGNTHWYKPLPLVSVRWTSNMNICSFPHFHHTREHFIHALFHVCSWVLYCFHPRI